jgi:hypothetical protein
MSGFDLKNLPENIGKIPKQYHDNVRPFITSLIGANNEAAKKRKE